MKNKENLQGLFSGTALIIALGVGILLCGLAVPAEAAEDDLTAWNESMLNETLPYDMTEQYQQDVEYWYAYYLPLKTVENLRGQIYAILIDGSKSWEDKQYIIKPLMGWDYVLETYMDSSKRTIDEYTGAVTYDLGFGNGFLNLFGVGIDENTLPKTQAEGDALYRIYSEHFNDYVQALHDAGDP